MADIPIEQLSEEIGKEFEQYSKSVTEGIKQRAEASMKELVKRTKATAPVGKRRRHYKSNITSKILENKVFSISHLWYVKGADYRLSHLLNNGHALKGGGRYEGTGFITKAEKEVVEEYEKAVEEVIENGG